MIVNEKDITTEGELGGRKIEMSLDQNSLIHLMGVLSDLYSNPVAAIVREYITNALDSHAKSGQTRPVEITKPNRMSPFFVIQDFGVGMSELDIEEVFSKYGSSTKRESNTEVGMLGLGSKSAFTYTEQFTFTAIKDGVKVHAVISRDESGAGSIEIADTSLTDEHNGVTVKIPVTNPQEVNNEISEFVRYLPEGAVLVNGEAPERNLLFISDRVALAMEEDNHQRYYRHNRAYVVMGGVKYPVGSSYFYENNPYPVIFFVDIGDVDFTPNREELHYTRRTKEKLSNLGSIYNEAAEEYLKERSQNLSSFRDAFDLQKETSDLIGRNKRVFFNGIAAPDLDYRVPVSTIGPDGGVANSEMRMSYLVDRVDDSSIVFVENWKNKRISKVQGEKIAKHLALTKRVSVILGDPPELKWMFPDAKTVDWNKVKKEQIAQTASTKKRRKERLWNGYVKGGGEQEFSPDKSKRIIHVPKSQLDLFEAKVIMNDGDQLVFVTNSERDTFLRRYPKAISFPDARREFLKSYILNPTEEDLDYIGGQRESYSGLESHAHLIEDPKLRKIVGAVDQDTTEVGWARNRYKTAQRAYYNHRSEDMFKNVNFPELSEIENYVDENYPILESIYKWRVDKDHLVIYANAVYNKKKEEDNG